MASTATTTPDTLVTLKVNFNGNSRRLKLPLRDLVAATLEEKLRSSLAIPREEEALIERYSDSAAAFVVLDATNVSVYKQLYRAAKAKQRLKIRITTKVEEPAPEPTPESETEVKIEPKQVPKPVTVEDEPEPKLKSEPTVVNEPKVAAKDKAEEVAPVPAAEDKPKAGQTHQTYEERLADIARLTERLRQVQLNAERRAQMKNYMDSTFMDVATLERTLEKIRDHVHQRDSRTCTSTNESASSSVPVPTGQSEQSKWFENCMNMVPTRPQFAICCNSCDQTIPNEHFHCSICDDGDFDLCQNCVDSGITCHKADHWLIKRSVVDGQIKYSTTERVAPKPKAEAHRAPSAFDLEEPAVAQPQAVQEPAPPAYNPNLFNVRTCNCCVRELLESQFVHCTVCEDFDLCVQCFAKDNHGHHPKHGFVAATADMTLDNHVQIRLPPGRNQSHNAICDGCDSYIRGVRHKCLDCPDWDYCSSCIINAGFIHPNHRFVPVYEPLVENFFSASLKPTHNGICCDGPLCANPRSAGGYIRGDRYKCAVCHDTDFCAACEASPANTHNRTHPLIKFKTPVRHVSVTTSGEHEDGRVLPRMGDRAMAAAAAPSSSRSTETVVPENTASPVQTVVDVTPVAEAEAAKPELEVEAKEEEVVEAKEEAKEEAVEKSVAPAASDLVAAYVTDTVTDGTVIAPNVVFEQTWVLCNRGDAAWPAGCSVKFVGGDYMGHVDPNHPAGIHELVSASESTVCYAPLAPGQEFSFTVLLRTPSREGRVISYWRLTTKEGIKFGPRLWCDVDVQAPKPVVVEPPKAVEVPPPVQSQMIFPKLETESPEASAIQAAPAAETKAPEAEATKDVEDFEECGDEEWDEDSDEAFMTDEEYDILDASDEEYLQEQSKKLLKK